MQPRVAVETEIYAEHSQFYVVDVGAEYRADLVWDGHGLERHLGVAEGIVAVGTIGHTFLPVSVELWDEDPRVDLEEWDHVVEASLDVSSGRLGLHSAEGPAELESLEVAPGTYRVRSLASGLDGADEMDGGDTYRLQVWPAPVAEPEVVRWWPPWDPAGAESRPTTASGRIVLGAEAEETRHGMRWLATGDRRHLFRAHDGTLWEHTNLPDARGTPQLEELDEPEAVRRYGARESWGPPPPKRPSVGQIAKAVWQTWRYSRGWRPPPGSP